MFRQRRQLAYRHCQSREATRAFLLSFDECSVLAMIVACKMKKDRSCCEGRFEEFGQDHASERAMDGWK